MSNVTAVIMSREPHRRDVPGCKVLNFNRAFRDIVGFKEAWMAALRCVTTEWFFFLDVDDQVPKDFQRVLDLCLAQETPIVYTDELRINDARVSVRMEKAPYSEEALIQNVMLMHHLVLCRTELAQAALVKVPPGLFLPEPIVYFEVAKQGGATYIPEIGYHWHRGAGGLSTRPESIVAQVRTHQWIINNRTPEPAPRKSKKGPKQ